MKNLLFVISTFCALNVNAQSYLITFSGTGAANTVTSVEVKNLKTGIILTVNGDDVLRLTGTVGISDALNEYSSRMKIYPNPMTDKSTLLISPPEEGNAVISVCDITGKIVTQIKSYLENYTQEFTLSGLNNGMYIVNVKGNTYQLSGKLISNGKSNGTTSIEKVSGNIAVDKKESKMNNKGTMATVDMEYTAGDRLKFTGSSGIYSTVKTDIPEQNKTITFNFIECTDQDDNHYSVVQLGTQVWMAENLKTTKYLSGDPIGTTTPSDKNISSESDPKYQWAYDGNESNVPTYGRLYTYYTVVDSRKICPTGWHVPADAEWTTLTDYLTSNGYGYEGSGPDIAKSMATTSGWTASATSGTVGNDQPGNNSSGLTALPGGNRYSLGEFGGLGDYGIWRSSTAWNALAIYNDLDYVYNDIAVNANGFSVRCVKD